MYTARRSSRRKKCQAIGVALTALFLGSCDQSFEKELPSSHQFVCIGDAKFFVPSDEFGPARIKADLSYQMYRRTHATAEPIFAFSFRPSERVEYVLEGGETVSASVYFVAADDTADLSKSPRLAEIENLFREKRTPKLSEFVFDDLSIVPLYYIHHESRFLERPISLLINDKDSAGPDGDNLGRRFRLSTMLTSQSYVRVRSYESALSLDKIDEYLGILEKDIKRWTTPPSPEFEEAKYACPLTK